MPLTTVAVAKGVGVKKGFGLLFKIKFLIFIVIFAIILFNSILVFVQTGNIDPLVTEVGGRIAYTTMNLNIESLKIISQGVVIDTSQGFFNGIWEASQLYSKLFTSIFFIWVWISLLSWLVEKSPIGDASRWFVNNSIGFIFFMIIQLLFLLFIQPNDITKMEALKIPFIAFFNFFKALPIIIAPFVNLASKFSEIDLNKTMVNKTIINQTINSTL